ncbi:helix-turn-helix transcriptional regulator [Streptomyces sp. WAC 06783]|uniref:helix-turn-helix domain-containing protein n=1 Tax=Streptomyces sp. WAC 06783 TaxID=2203211 RepID=UPI00163CAF3A|nr:helix-turn-helix transcriptional regulator [Streptomyces sp. WAC 06783]
MSITSLHTAALSPDLGALIRGGRGARRPKMTQAQLAVHVGYSASWVCRVEAGEIIPPVVTLLRIAAALDISPDELTRAAHPPERGPSPVMPSPGGPPAMDATVATGISESQQEGTVRRRGFLTGAAGVSAVLLTGTRAAAEQPPGELGAGLETALFNLPTAGPVPISRLERALGRARDDFRHTRYQTLSAELPLLLAAADATRDHLTGHARERANALASYAYSLAGEFASKQRSEATWVAADRALTAARACGQPAPLGEATRMLSVAMRRAGRYRQAADLLLRTSRQLADDPTDQARAVRAAMLLTCGYTCAHYGDRTVALGLVDEAQEIGQRISYGPSLDGATIQATRAQCESFRLSIYNKLGVPDEAAPIVGRIDASAFQTAERRARFHTDAARMYHQLGDDIRTFASLRAIERQAPEEARRPSVKALTTDLLYSSAQPGLKEFAARTGALKS